MKRYYLILILVFSFIETNSIGFSSLSRVIINDLILIKNTYNWVNDVNIKKDMIRRQNKLINKNNKSMYKNYLIVE